MQRIRLSWLVLAATLLAGCAANPYVSDATARSGRLSEATIVRHASGGALRLEDARVITGNDAAFRSKLRTIESAEHSIDAMYYIYADDYSSSVLSEALIAAARRGVRVRLLVDYHSNYKNLDLFTMMERVGSAGAGSLEVRFYGRPTREIVQDAVYATMGCGEARERFPANACSKAKTAALAERFEAERIDERPAAELGISNLDSGYSGIFLSGLYAKQPDLMAFAVLNGQSIDPAAMQESGTDVAAADRAQLRHLGRLYWQSRAGSGFERVAAKIQLAFLSALFGEWIAPLHEALVSHLPAERQGVEAAARDWEHLTDFLHHKLLLVDARRLQLGGRNVEDSYHMRANALLDKYRFLDTDLRADVVAGGGDIERAFEALWGFRPMVATTAEIRRHAPNDMAANADAFAEARAACENRPIPERGACVATAFAERALPLAERERQRAETMAARADRYRAHYAYADAPDPKPSIPVDPGALAAYIENVPFMGGPGAPPARRAYGSENGREAMHGKRIHALWLAGMRNACATATADDPKRIVLHHAYFFPPSNLVKAIARTIDGTWDCRHVRLTVLTNSLETTDLSMVNLFARHSAKAFAEYYRERRHPGRSARLEYLEYLATRQEERLSLHTKVTVLGDDVMVGSANADVRSLMMDTNNAMLLRDAPHFLEAYLAHLDALAAEPGRVADRTAAIAATPRERMLAQDRANFRAMMARYRAERWLDAEQRRRVEATLVDRLDEAYALTRGMLAGAAGTDDAATFDRLFKGL